MTVNVSALFHRRGFSLLLTLIILSAVTILVIGLFSLAVTEKQVSASFGAVEQAELALDAGFAKATGLLVSKTNNDDYLICAKPVSAPLSTTTADARNRVRQHLYVARYDTVGAVWKYTPLISGVAAPADSKLLTMDHVANVDPDPVTPATKADGTPADPAVGYRHNPLVAGDTPTTTYPKTLPWKVQPDPLKPDVFWEELHAPDASGADQLLARYCYQVEDLQAQLPLDNAGNIDGVSLQHVRTPFAIGSTLLPVPGMNLNPTKKKPAPPVLNQAALYTLLYPKATDDTGITDNWIIQARQTQFTPDMWKETMLANGLDQKWLTRISTGDDAGRLPVATSSDPNIRALEESSNAGARSYAELAVIPAYPTGGTLPAGHVNRGPAFNNIRDKKLNLNKLLRDISTNVKTPDQAVTEIASFIRTHLPNFENRAGGFTLSAPASKTGQNPQGFAYLECLAAGMIDYADTDSLPTINLGEYRGMDSYPLVNEQWERYRFEGTTKDATNEYVLFSVTHYFELWNLTSQPISGQVQAQFECKGTVQVGAGNYVPEQNMNLVTNPALSQLAQVNGHWWQGPINMTLAPNEYTVIAFPPVIFSFRSGPKSGTTTKATFRGFDNGGTSDLSSRYHLKYAPAGSSNFVLVDEPLKPVERYTRDVYGNKSPAQKFNGTVPGMSYAVQNSNFADNIGDPRAAWFIDYSQDVVNYVNGASPWGRNVRSNIPTAIYGNARVMLWPDGGHDTTPGKQSIGNEDINPDAAKPSPMPAIEPEKYVQRISNAGKYYSVTELGHIFDPMLWDANGGSEYDVPTYENFADILFTATASGKYCGGNTLRIGRVEHSRFRPSFSSPTAAGRLADRRECATSLLDLFHCGIPTSGSTADLTGDYILINGHVNLNTATRDTLRALAAGKLVMDAATTVPTVIQPPTTSGGDQADQVADLIIKRRPFISAAEIPEKLQDEKTVGSYDWNDALILGATSRNPASTVSPEWNDAAAEEVFARIYNSSTVRSRNFRILVTGQTLRKNRSGQTEVLATRSRIYHVFIRPERDTSGTIISQHVDITYERQL